MLGVLFGLGCAVAFGINQVIVRRGMLRISSDYIASISIFTGPPFFLLATAITGDIFRLGQYSWRAYVFYALSGIIHFAFGRTWAYRSVQLIGVTRSGIVTSMNFAVTILLAMIVFGETLTPLKSAGIALALFGPLIMGLKEAPVSSAARSNGLADVDRKTLYKGILFGVGAAFFWGSSAILIKLGSDNGGPPVLGSLVAYTAASIAVSPTVFLRTANKKEMLNAPWKSLRLGLLSGCTSNVAQMLRYMALAYAPVILVSITQRTTPLWVLSLSYMVNRRYESFSRWVLLGNGTLMVGTLLALVS